VVTVYSRHLASLGKMGRRKLPTFSNYTMIQLSATPKPPANSRKRGRRDANIDPLSEEGDVPEASTPQKPMVRLPKGKDPQESIAPVDRVATRSDTGKAKSSAVIFFRLKQASS
jgi:hypothetical protein